ncbi:uncharacterized protein LOC123316803 [Coccinella septempunctata]|uniref:uncharacterized protein LOC123316803 n=1 Tax=Coccinella septempunctata TaxID=41139 RepID=UPI001D0740F8|nr:uncharacterized protein LOC123316803 [Coccinella septempunctata]
MEETKKKLFSRRNITETSMENRPLSLEKNNPSSTNGSSQPEENEKIINISLSGNRQNPSNGSRSKFQIPNQPCQTTINLYINDPHIMQKSWDKYRRAPPRRKMRNEIVLGKSIPDHTLMKNLLGDLGIKKYSSAPNMTNKYIKPQRMNPTKERFPSERSFTDSTEVMINEEAYRNFEKTNAEKEATLLYVNERKSGGDFMKNSIEMINEEEEEEREAVAEEDNNCPVHCDNNSAVKKLEYYNVKEEDRACLKDPMKRFRRKPFRTFQMNKNPAILYRDINASKQVQNEREQPRRMLPSFHLRTRMVRDFLDINPEQYHSYQSGLMKNHKRLFDSLRHKNFQCIMEENSYAEKDAYLFADCRILTFYLFSEFLLIQLKILALFHTLQLPRRNKSGKIDQIDVKQSKLILCGKNRRPICSSESHGSYEEYRKNLVKAPDGSLCCRNVDFRDEDEDIWSRAETRNMITSEFVKDKVKKFDKLINKNSAGPKDSQKLGSRDEKILMYKYETAEHPFQGIESLPINFNLTTKLLSTHKIGGFLHSLHSST